MVSKPRNSSDQVTQYIEAPEWLEKKVQLNLEILLDLDPKKDFNRAAILVVHHFQQAHKRALEYQEKTPVYYALNQIASSEY